MSTVAIEADCCCGSIGRTDLRQCPVHFRIYRGDVRLTSIRRIIKPFFPLPPIPDEVLENARERGKEVDEIFGALLRGTITAIPWETREDSRDLILKLVNWFNKQNFRSVEVGVLVGDEDHGGILDFRFDGAAIELKATSQVQIDHRLQCAGYANLLKTDGAILHVTKNLKEPKLRWLTPDDQHDWHTLLTCWRMLKRREAAVTIEDEWEV